MTGTAAWLKPGPRQDALREPQGFRDALVTWFGRHGRDYPWRRTRDPYAILVSEVMLQQTQIATVLGRGFYQRFLEAFPDPAALATAADEPLLKAWEGLGYYRRARMLRETARAVCATGSGRFPEDTDALLELPGIGRYTAGAMRAFAFGLPAVVVDGNVARVLARLMDFQAPVDDTVGVRRLWDWAAVLADPGRPREYHAALMELGQTLCRPGVPDCLACPVAGFCRTRVPETLPVKRTKQAITAVDEHAVWQRDERGHLLMHRESAKRRQGLWKLPTRPAAELAGVPVIAEEAYTITRYRVSLRVHAASGAEPHADECWHPPEEVMALAMPSPFRRVITRLLGES